nr:type II toxin-antitoxin system VapC family toxin [Microbacterium pseudoresistens]
MIYVDTSAALKRVFEEDESAALMTAIDEAVLGGDRLISSHLTRVELGRGIRRRIEFESHARLTSAFEAATADIAFAPMSPSIIESARIIGPPVLRSLDAIHLAAAIAVGAGEVWTYDERLAAASEEMGIVARMPS